MVDCCLSREPLEEAGTPPGVRLALDRGAEGTKRTIRNNGLLRLWCSHTWMVSGTWGILAGGRSLVAHVTTLALVPPCRSFASNTRKVRARTQESEAELICESSQNLLEFLGRPGPMETCKTFPLGFRTASSPWPTWNWICLDPEELNGPQLPFFTLNSRLEGR